jgi:hypothetical protein
MRKIVKLMAILLVLAFIVMQFFQPEKNRSDNNEKHLIYVEDIPSEVKQILKNACLDCHSDNTNYLWYHQPAPVSWMINKHVIEGKKELNLSEWGDMDIFDRIGNLEEICQEAKNKSMPLKSYTLMHPKAKLSDEEIELLCNWTTSFSEQLLEEAIKD